MTEQRCPDAQINELYEAIGEDAKAAILKLNQILVAFPDDTRLHLLKGTILSNMHEYDVAITCLRRAVELSPDNILARFQLGIVLLTVGKLIPAQEVWGPLYGLPDDHTIRSFVDGLNRLARAEYQKATRILQDAIGANTEYKPLNRDINLIIERMQRERNH